MRLSAIATVALAVTVLMTGCGGRVQELSTKQEEPVEAIHAADAAPKPTGTQPKSPAADGTGPSDATQAARAKPPKPVYPEFSFRPVTWIGGAPVTLNEAGIWLYTKEQHPGNANLAWDQYDLLLARLPLEQFKGHEVTVLALQDLGGDVVRIVTRVVPSESQKERQPAAWLNVDRGALAGKRFVVVDESYKEIPLD